MDQTQTVPENRLTRPFVSSTNPVKLLLTVVIAAVLLGSFTGFILSTKGGDKGLTGSGLGSSPAKNPEADTKTFRDFAEGTIKAKPEPKEGDYTEGTHLLQRQGAVPVALTSSVVDLSEYEGKKVKVYGETQKALKEGWLMDVGKVEVIE